MKTRSLSTLAAFAAALAGCASPMMLSTPLAWRPGDDPSDLRPVTAEFANGWGGTVQATGPDMSGQVYSAFEGQSLLVTPFTDARVDRSAIGANQEKNPPRPVTTPDDVAAFVTAHVVDVLRASRVPVVSVEGTRVLKGAIVEYFVREENRYNGTVMLDLTLTDASGGTLWHGTVHGAQSKWGRSFSADNYNENLSDALVRAVHQLLMDPAFLAAVHKKSK